jgi:hypothetical protein
VRPGKEGRAGQRRSFFFFFLPTQKGKSDGKKIQLFSNAFPSNSKFKNAAYSTLNFFFFVVFFFANAKG